MRNGLPFGVMLAATVAATGLGITLRAASARAEDDTRCYYMLKYPTGDGGTICANTGKACRVCRIKI